MGGLLSFAFATKVTNAVNHSTFAQYDYFLGRVVDWEDANGIVSSTYFSDPLDRPTQVIRAVNNVSAKNQTTFNYDDSGRIITTSSDRTNYGDNILVNKVLYDGLGRTIETRQYEGGSNYVATQQQYDALGRVFKSSNPFRSWQSETALWTTSVFDALGRVTSVTTPDSAVVTTSYSGNTVTVTDQAGKQRKSITDALGRLIQVYEAPNVPSLNYLTSYAYDVFDNLTTVAQGVQTRTYVYNSLKQLISATNPESGTITYEYDENGNLKKKTDVRGVFIQYAYDALNRSTTVDYSDTTAINPDITRIYDGATNGKGRFWYSYAGGNYSSGANVEHTSVDSYSAVGNPLVQRQLFKLNSAWGPTYQISRGYNLAGAVTSQTYPSGRTVSYAYDDAGRSNSFTGNLGDGVQRNYATEMLYSAFGGLRKERFGTDTPIYNKSFYNSRGQLSEIRVSTSYTGDGDTTWNRGAIINHYSNGCWGMCGGEQSTQSMTDNNGNLYKQEVYIPHNDQVSSYTTWWHRYEYDSLNRLQRVGELTAQLDWQQEYVYDRYGNRTIHQTNTWGYAINKTDFTVNTTNNRLGVPNGQAGVMTYDGAGNLLIDTYTGAGDRT